MKLVMIVLNPDGTIARTQAIPLSNTNSLKKLACPFLGTHEIYQLKKNRQVEVDTGSGSIKYSLIDSKEQSL
jgi:hypothetical protein